MDNIFVRAWQGRASLAAAFWLVYFVFGIILALLLIIIFSLTMPNFQFAQHSSMITAIQFPYTLFAAICVWRCGRNSNALWRILSRIVVVLAILSGLINIWSAVTGHKLNATMQTETQTTTTETTAPGETTTTTESTTSTTGEQP